MKHIVFFSGGAVSWAAAKRVAEKHGTKDLILLFTDTKMEDEDLYRFLEEGAKNVGGELIKLADGRNPWEVFFDVKFLGNSRVDPCSKILKRDLAQSWIRKNFKPDECILYLGINWIEEHRLHTSRKYWEPYTVEAPMCEQPFMVRPNILEWIEKEGIEVPRLYKLGFWHNNCSAFCIKAGQGQFKQLLEHFPEKYKYHEEKEQEIQEYLNKDVTILRKLNKLTKKKDNYSLKQLREDVEASKKVDEDDIGGCGCFMDDNEETNKICENDIQ